MKATSRSGRLAPMKTKLPTAVFCVLALAFAVPATAGAGQSVPGSPGGGPEPGCQAGPDGDCLPPWCDSGATPEDSAGDPSVTCPTDSAEPPWCDDEGSCEDPQPCDDLGTPGECDPSCEPEAENCERPSDPPVCDEGSEDGSPGVDGEDSSPGADGGAGIVASGPDVCWSDCPTASEDGLHCPVYMVPDSRHHGNGKAERARARTKARKARAKARRARAKARKAHRATGRGHHRPARH